MSELYSDFTLTQDNCANEPIHRPEAIQGTGYLLALDAAHPDRVIAASDGIGDLLGISDTDLWAGRVATHLPPEMQTTRDGLLAAKPPASSGALRWSIGKQSFDIVGSRHAGAVVIELEAADDLSGDADSHLRFADALRGADDVDALCATAVNELRDQLGYDRIMVYRFDPDGHGFVAGEAKRDDLEPYLGLHYPATDIPQPSRDLLQRVRVRSIADIALPNRALHFNPDRRSGDYLDLTYSHLRATSPIHIEYLGNMGVRATLTIAIEVRGHLWGLFACHHYSPRNPDYRTRHLAETEALLFSLRLQEIKTADAVRNLQRSRDAEDAVVGAIRVEDRYQLRLIGSLEPLMALCDCDGAAKLTSGRDPVRTGETFPSDILNALRDHLHDSGTPELLITDDIAADLPDIFEDVNGIGGLLAVRVSEVSGSYFVWFRRQQRQNVTWAGDPRLPQTTAYTDAAGN